MDDENGSFYKKAAKYAFITLFLVVILALVLYSIGGITNFISGVISSLSAVIVGAVIAYLLNPLLNLFERKVFCKVRKNEPRSRLRRFLSTACVYIVFLVVVYAFFSLIIPSIKDNFGVFEEKYGTQEKAIASIDEFLANSFLSQYRDTIITALKDNRASIISLMYDVVLPLVRSYAVNIASGLWTFIIGFVYSFYLLYNRDMILALTKKFSTAFIPEKIKSAILKFLRLIDNNFGKYLRGKIIDSIIVGIVSYAIYTLLGFRFAPVLSLIAGVTNMIPFFGPFIGAVPAALIVLVAQPSKTILLCLVILVIQQLDGNILDPIIVGGQVGLIPIFTMSSTLFFGGLFGITGMLLGVPVFATVYTLIGELITKLLKKKGKSSSLGDYY